MVCAEGAEVEDEGVWIVEEGRDVCGCDGGEGGLWMWLGRAGLGEMGGDDGARRTVCELGVLLFAGDGGGEEGHGLLFGEAVVDGVDEGVVVVVDCAGWMVLGKEVHGVDDPSRRPQIPASFPSSDLSDVTPSRPSIPRDDQPIPAPRP